MNRFLLSFAAILVATNIFAQDVVTVSRADASLLINRNNAAQVAPAQVPAYVEPLGTNEYITGYYTDSKLPSSNYALGLANNPGTWKVGSVFKPSILDRFVGGKIKRVRFALATSTGSSVAQVYVVNSNGSIPSSPVASGRIDATAEGWNEITLTEPVTVEENKEYLIVFSYKQESGKYPLLTDAYFDYPEVSGGFYFYGNLGTGNKWTDFSQSGNGNILIQAVVEAQLPDDDLKYESIMYGAQFAKAGETFNITSKVNNYGGSLPASYDVDVQIDGNLLKSFSGLTTVDKAATISVELPADLAAGKHQLKAFITKINGNPAQYTLNNDTATLDFYCYAGGFARQKQLIEQFTSQYCTYCPKGTTCLKAATSDRNDIALVSIHGDMSSGSDIFNNAQADSVLYCLALAFPTGSFNRVYYPEEASNCFGLAWNSTSSFTNFFNSVVDYSNLMPAYATINIASEFSADDNMLNVTVSGDIDPAFSAILGEDARISVFLTEDNLVAKQYNNGAWNNSYTHNNVFRSAMGSVWGNPLNINGNKYENHFSQRLNTTWNRDNMHIIAFISKPMSIKAAQDDIWVDNCESTTIGTTQGIHNITDASLSNAIVARYNAEGQLITAPVKGINILKLANGQTIKVVVK